MLVVHREYKLETPSYLLGFCLVIDYSALSGPPLQQDESFDSHFESTSPHIRFI